MEPSVQPGTGIGVAAHAAQAPLFNVGQEVVIQPSPSSQQMWGVISSANWNEAFNEFAYGIKLQSHSGYATAWERDIRVHLSPEHMADILDEPHTRRAWWLDLHTSSEMFTGTTITDLESSVQRAAKMARPFLCPINPNECDYPSCVIAGSPFVTDICVEEQMRSKKPVEAQ